jgi:magnesium-transporting ATPase (P-type)
MTRIAPVVNDRAASEHRDWIDLASAAILDADDVLRTLGTSRDGPTVEDARNRLTHVGANTVPEHRVTLTSTVRGQLRSPLLMLLFATAVLSAVLGQQTNAIIIIVILFASVGLGAGNDYRAARAAKALQADVRDKAMTVRPSGTIAVDVACLVPGDIVRLTIGSIVPADIRLIQANGLSCEESVLTGEALPVEKSIEPSAAGASASSSPPAPGPSLEGSRVTCRPRRRRPPFRSGCGSSRCYWSSSLPPSVVRYSPSTCCSADRRSTRCCSRPRSRSASRPSCCRLSSRPARPTDRVGWPTRKYWSNV